MDAPPRPVSQIVASNRNEHAIVRCLYGAQPVHRARGLVADVLTWLGRKDDVFEAELAVDELVSNAFKHAPAPYELRVYLSAAGVKVAVVDRGADHSDLARRLAGTTIGQQTEMLSGRGLQLIAGFFHGRCGVEPTTTCTGLGPAKQVWFALPQ